MNNGFLVHFYLKILVFFLLLFICVNTFNVFSNQQYSGIMPLCIQSLILFLVFKKSTYVVIIVKIWSMIFIILGVCLKLYGLFFVSLVESANVSSSFMLYQILLLLLGTYFFFYAEKGILVNEKK